MQSVQPSPLFVFLLGYCSEYCTAHSQSSSTAQVELKTTILVPPVDNGRQTPGGLWTPGLWTPTLGPG